ncbi:MAG: glutathione S-transferase family protein [Rhabdaerophilum sp.]
MILIGQYDSPFVRRVGIALRLYGVPFEHKPWSVFGDVEKIRTHHPLTRVPTLVLDDGTALADSHIILDYLDSHMPPEKRLFPVTEPARHKALRIATLATGLGDKVVSLFYEKRLHSETSDIWVARCQAQIAGVLTVLEVECVSLSTPYWFGHTFGHADIAVACMVRFVSEAHPGLVDWAIHPALFAHAAKLENLPVFQEIRQIFIPPA